MKKQILVTTTTIGAPLAASSHVEVTPNTAAAGSYADISLRVPTESITATTTKLEVDIPAATPFPSVSYLSVPGWDTELLTGTLPTPVTVDKSQITEALNRVVWSALPGSEIKMNEIRQFTPSVGAVPGAGKVVFHTLQTCSDGSVVAWTGSGENADHPSPVLSVNDTPVADHGEDAVTTKPTGHEAETTTAVTTSRDTLARVLSIGGFVGGAVVAVLSVVTLRRGVTG